jgi:hypothetical protein
MKKLEIKNEIVGLFNSIDSTTLGTNGQSWYEWLGNSVKVIEKHYEKMPKEQLQYCLNFSKLFLEDSENLKK